MKSKHHDKSMQLKFGEKATNGIQNMTMMRRIGIRKTTTTSFQTMNDFVFTFERFIGTFMLFARKLTR